MVIKYPLLSEKAVDLVEKENKLVFVVEKNADKIEVKRAVEELYKVKVLKVNTFIDRKGRKKAFVQLAPESSAVDIATQLKII
jgi:large subunit ribosomal protein L23